MTGSSGRADFVERHGLWDEADCEAAAEMLRRIEADEVEVVRFSFPDQHGILRGKAVMADEVAGALAGGVSMTSTLLVKDTAHKTVPPVFRSGAGIGVPELTGAADFLMVADPATFRVLPWAPGTGWVLCDIRWPDGRAIPFSTRDVCRASLARLAERGYDYVTGVEVEFHIFRLEDPRMEAEGAGQPAAPPEVSLLTHGYQYLTEIRLDELDPIFAVLRRELTALGLRLRSLEVEFGPSQVEVTFQPGTGLESADTMILFRNAVKQICARHGYHATFMCRPQIENVFASGWHLHQSLRDRETGRPLFMPGEEDGEGTLLSALGRRFAAGILDHARAASVFTTPTINGYKRFKAFPSPPTGPPGRATTGARCCASSAGRGSPARGSRTAPENPPPTPIYTSLRRSSPGSTASTGRPIPERPPRRPMTPTHPPCRPA